MADATSDPIAQFEGERRDFVNGYPGDAEWQKQSIDWVTRAFSQKYMYNFDWLGRPVIQFPADMVAYQEVVWAVKPDLIIETGIAHGGSLVLSASLLAMLDYADAVAEGTTLDPANPKRKVLGVDIDIRDHNRKLIEEHPMSSRIDMLQGSSVTDEMAAQVAEHAKGYKTVLVSLDSMHTHEHVAKELAYYAPLVTPGSYCLVFDTIVEDMDDSVFPDRPWSQGDNPKTAVWEFLKENPDFEIDQDINQKLLISAVPDGWLRRKS
ncbi:cephalosporin hydroxylase family protein [Nocardioides sp. MH1]|uniref:cephalosporin hydroxylase family protein n=1 Tax=Nocardioides sp. MH1 TaxID=3242490 RepID=UPI0035208F28